MYSLPPSLSWTELNSASDVWYIVWCVSWRVGVKTQYTCASRSLTIQKAIYLQVKALCDSSALYFWEWCNKQKSLVASFMHYNQSIRVYRRRSSRGEWNQTIPYGAKPEERKRRRGREKGERKGSYLYDTFKNNGSLKVPTWTWNSLTAFREID